MGDLKAEDPFGGTPDFCLCSQCTIYLSVDFLPGAFEIEINGQLVFSKLENGGFPYEKDVSIYSVGRTSWSPYPNSASSCHSTSLSSSSLRPSEEPVMENP